MTSNPTADTYNHFRTLVKQFCYDKTEVDNLCGNGVGTFADLQSLITNSGDTIILDKDYKYDSTTDSSLTNGITIGKNITINGNGHIIDGNSTARAFNISGQYTVNLNNLIIQNNTSDEYGGAIYTENSTITINNSTIQNNQANYNGGAIYVGYNSRVTIINSTIQNNQANNNGGAIQTYLNSQTSITNCNFTNNTATYWGGAIHIYNSQINITNSMIKNNTATNYANIYCGSVTTVYNCDIDNITTTCYNVTNKPYLTDLPSASTSQAGTVQLVNDLTTGGTTKALTAEQGKELNTLIGQAISYINQ